MSQVDLSRAMKLLSDTGDLCDSIDGERRVNPSMESNSKKRAAANADISRTLLYAAHMADLARIEILNQYHMFKGEEDVPTVRLPE